MVQNLREFMNKKPWVGWVVAVLFLGASVFFFFRGQRSQDLYSPNRMTEMVTVHFTDTDDEMTIPRGRLDKELRSQANLLDPSKGITNPKTGKPTGFLVDKEEWDAWVARINKEKAEAKQRPSAVFGPASSGKK